LVAVVEQLKLVGKLVLIGLFAVTIELTTLTQLPIFGVVIDLTPLVVVIVGYLLGSLVGVAFGFSIGLLVDLLLLQTLGATSLVYLLVGYVGGRVKETRNPDHELVPIVLGGLASLLAGVGLGLLQFLQGVEAPISGEVVRVLAVNTLFNALFALPVFALIRRLLRKYIDSPSVKKRRRRTYTTGGLSPLSGSRGRE